MSGLFKKTTGSLVWSFLETVVIKGFGFLCTLLLTKMLVPEDFGLVTMIAIFISLGNVLVEAGLGASLIRYQEADQKDYSSVFWGNLFISIVVYLILFLSAPFISSYFNQPVLTMLVRVNGLLFILLAMNSIQQNLLIKKMMFKKLTLRKIPGVICGGSCAVLLAYFDYGVWSIVSLQLITQFVNSVFLWTSSDWVPDFRFDITRFRFHFRFGSKLMLNSVLDAVFNELYSVIVGKRYSAFDLGNFGQARTYSSYPPMLISGVVNNVTYPALSKIIDDPDKISRAFRTILRVLFFSITPLMISVAVVSKPLFLVMFSEDWLDASYYFKFLVFSSMLLPVHAFNINVFKLYDRTDLFLKLGIIKNALVVIVAVVGGYLGLMELIYGMVIISYLALFINMFYSAKMIGYGISEQLKDMIPVLVIGLLSGAVAYFVIEYFAFNSYLKILIGVLISLIFYFSLHKIFNTASFNESNLMLRRLINGSH